VEPGGRQRRQRGPRRAWVAGLVDLGAWPPGARLVVGAERAHPGAQLSVFDTEAGLRHTAFITDATPYAVDGRLAALGLRHRRHARIEDRIRRTKAAGLRNRPSKDGSRTRPLSHWSKTTSQAGR